VDYKEKSKANIFIIKYSDIKDLKKRVTLETAQQSRLFERLQNKPFWIWNIEAHKQEDVKIIDCC
jgi:hypothetical protein